MPPIGHHIIIRLRSDRVLTPTSVQRRIAARVVLEQGRVANLINFSIPDTHAHIKAACSDAASHEMARRVELSLGRRLHLPVGFERARVKPIRDVWHHSSLFTYVFNQYRHHGLDWDPYFEATNLPDLLGMRLIGAYTSDNVGRALPRIGHKQLLKWFGCDTVPPADSPVERLLDAASAAAALPSLHGSSRDVLTARRAVVEIAHGQLQQNELTELLRISRTSLHRLRQRPVDQRLVEAIRLQLSLRAMLK